MEALSADLIASGLFRLPAAAESAVRRAGPSLTAHLARAGLFVLFVAYTMSTAPLPHGALRADQADDAGDDVQSRAQAVPTAPAPIRSAAVSIPEIAPSRARNATARWPLEVGGCDPSLAHCVVALPRAGRSSVHGREDRLSVMWCGSERDGPLRHTRAIAWTEWPTRPNCSGGGRSV